MTLPASPPDYRNAAGENSFLAIVKPIKFGEGLSSHGYTLGTWRVFALQSGLKSLGRTIEPDGKFGAQTKAVVERFQKDRGLWVDGIAGTTTQGTILRRTETKVHKEFPDLPNGVILGICLRETSGTVAPTNWYTPPNGEPGVDCGSVQWRIYGPPFDQDKLRAAFDPLTSFRFAATDLLDRIERLDARQPSLSDEFVLRAAIVAHNAPFLYEQIVRNGKLSTPNQLATWTNKPGGGYFTHDEHFYDYSDDVLASVR
jgi:peptidoglycan hydrolase-like protein with peptidoglycan-binding domain